jgi:hypothetical protein
MEGKDFWWQLQTAPWASTTMAELEKMPEWLGKIFTKPK